MSIVNMKPNSGAVIVNESNLPTGIVFKNKHLITNINCWHKFIVTNVHVDNLPRNTVLRAILDHVHPLDLIPVGYIKEKGTGSFLARNCGAAIQKLCNDNLVVPCPGGRPFKLSIILKFATTAEFKINVQQNIKTVLTKRYNSKRVLDLTRFHEDPDLTEFCPLSQPKIMFFVLHLSRNLTPLPERFIIRDNHIKVLNPLEAISGSNCLIGLDLGNNLIDDMKGLQPLKQLKVQELVLDGNPVCAQYTQESYVNEVKNYCSSLLSLDGVPLKAGNFPISKPNYLCDVEGLGLVNQFLEHYYTVYDSQNRRSLEDLYHTRAMFSLNSTYHHAQISSVSADMRKYNNISRNFKKMADISRNGEFLFRSKPQISNVLVSLPMTEHDPFSFKVDLMHYTAKCAVIAVSGVFRELPKSFLDPERFYGFRRTFAIEIVNGDRLCYIVNDMFHVYNALSFQVVESFKFSKPVAFDMRAPITEKEHQQAADALRIITNLTTDWAKKCLEECNYDIKKALVLFVDLYKADKIPKVAFSFKA